MRRNFRLFYVEFSKHGELMTENEYLNFVRTAVLHNKDIQSFTTIEIDSRLTKDQGNRIAAMLGFGLKYIVSISRGEKPVDAVLTNMIL